MEQEGEGMTLEEAIRHAEEKAKCGGQCGEEHEQLAEWLKELQERRAAELEKRTEERAKTHACDCISRRAALDCVSNSLVAWEAYEAIEALPSAQPTQTQRRFNADSTQNYALDCIDRRAAAFGCAVSVNFPQKHLPQTCFISSALIVAHT